jgi:hypothetical protein
MPKRIQGKSATLLRIDTQLKLDVQAWLAHRKAEGQGESLEGLTERLYREWMKKEESKTPRLGQ